VSRSYRKFPSYRSEIWKDSSFRTRNRLCIYREMRSPDYGDVVFPVPKEYFEISRRKDFDLKKETRDKYFLEIRNILNGYTGPLHYYTNYVFDEIFIEDFNRIKGGISGSNGGRGYYFEWLNNKKVKEAVKSWTGEPLEVLAYVTHRGYIEQAIRQQVKVDTRK